MFQGTSSYWIFFKKPYQDPPPFEGLTKVEGEGLEGLGNNLIIEDEGEEDNFEVVHEVEADLTPNPLCSST